MARRLNSDLAEKHRLPAIYPFRSFAEAGGLRAYGIDFPQRALGMTENQAAATGLLPAVRTVATGWRINDNVFANDAASDQLEFEHVVFG